MLSITTGVPQGLIIGPLFFIGLLSYIDDFAQASQMLSFLIYADDTTISSTLNMFSDYIHDQNLDSLINEELQMAQNKQSITKCSKIEIHDISNGKEKYTYTYSG